MCCNLLCRCGAISGFLDQAWVAAVAAANGDLYDPKDPEGFLTDFQGSYHMPTFTILYLLYHMPTKPPKETTFTNGNDEVFKVEHRAAWEHSMRYPGPNCASVWL